MKKKVSEESINKTERGFGKYILLAIIVLLIFLSYQIIEPYLIVLITSFVLAYLCKPVFIFLKKRVGASISAIICLIFILLVLILPAALLITNLASQASNAVKNTDVMEIVNQVTTLPFINQINFDWGSGVDRVGLFIFSLVGTIATKLPALLLSSLVFLFSFFYILVGWDSLTRQIKKFIPFEDKSKVTQDIDKATHGIIFGYLFVAILDFVVAATGFYLAGVKFYLLLAFLVAVFVFIPGLGPSLVCVPLLAYFVLVSNWYSVIITLIVWSILALLIETFIAAKILAGKTRIHPLIMLVGILGGTVIFGIFGFIIGPLILVYTIRLVKAMVAKN
jgi:predicted PurR-regulated permease PerM